MNQHKVKVLQSTRQSTDSWIRLFPRHARLGTVMFRYKTFVFWLYRLFQNNLEFRTRILWPMEISRAKSTITNFFVKLFQSMQTPSVNRITLDNRPILDLDSIKKCDFLIIFFKMSMSKNP